MANRPPAPGVVRPETLRPIGFVLVAGVVVYWIVVLALTWSKDPGPAAERFGALGWIAALVAVVAIPVAFGLRAWLYASVQRAAERGAALQAYASGSLLFFALLEGPALFNVLVWMLTAEPLPNALVPVFLVAAMVSGMPSARGFEMLRESGELR